MGEVWGGVGERGHTRGDKAGVENRMVGGMKATGQSKLTGTDRHTPNRRLGNKRLESSPFTGTSDYSSNFSQCHDTRHESVIS